LDDVPGIVLVAGQPQSQGIEVAGRGPDQLFKGPPVTLAGPGGQRVVTGPDRQRVSLWRVCARSQRQNFFISIRSRSFTLFLVVT